MTPAGTGRRVRGKRRAAVAATAGRGIAGAPLPWGYTIYRRSGGWSRPANGRLWIVRSLAAGEWPGDPPLRPPPRRPTRWRGERLRPLRPRVPLERDRGDPPPLTARPSSPPVWSH